MKTFDQMVELFEAANEAFLKEDKDLIFSGINERTLCGALMLHLHDEIQADTSFQGYYTDVEDNRNRGKSKTIAGPRSIRINCDLILHSRGRHPEQDNLIAIEMKKSTRPRKEKQSDRERLAALTSDSLDDYCSFDGENDLQHVCRYVLGVYYEINIRRNVATIEYYHESQMVKQYVCPIK